MLLLVYTACIIVLFILCVRIIVFWIQEQIHCVKLLNKIPGPPTIPVLGNAVAYFCCPQEKVFLLARKNARDYYPIYKLCGFYTFGVFIMLPEDVELIISSTKHIEKGRMYHCLHGWLGTGLLTSSGKKWHSRRKLLTPTFHFSILKQFLLVFDKQSDLLIDAFKTECKKSYTDITPHISRFTLNSICVTAMGISPDELFKNMEEDYISAIYKIGESTIYRVMRPWLHNPIVFFFTTTFWKLRRLQNMLHLFSLRVIKKRKIDTEYTSNIKDPMQFLGKGRLAMLDLLIAAQKEDSSLEDEDIREEVDTFMFEGHDTIAVSICYTLMLLACHQDIQERVRQEVLKTIDNSEEKYSYENLQELKYLEMVLKESLRMYPSVPLISRVTSEEVRTHSGYILPKNTQVQVYIYDIHHNPIYYPDPLKFDPDRFLPENCKNRHPYAYIPFSAGPRNCIGQRFAMLELKMVIAKIVKHFYLRPVDTPSSIEFTADLLLRTTRGIKIKLERRNI